MAENKKYDLAVAYRIYPKVSKVPPVYPDDKYKLSELCLKSFKESFGDMKVKIWVILDNCPPEYTDLFKKYFDSPELELINLGFTGNNGTFKKQLEILLNQEESELVYFAEDDYFYLPGCFSRIIDFMKAEGGNCFVTPFDHPDYYNLKIHDYKYQVKYSGCQQWRTGGSTCMTFLTTKQVLKETEKVLLTYSRGNYDASMWFSLTKKRIFNPFYFRNNEDIRIFVKAWFNCWRQILFGKKRYLWAPVPSLCTHMDDIHLAPGIDWQSLFAESEK